MYRKLSDLKQRVDDLIATYGEDHGVAAFLFCDSDVFTIDENHDEQYLNEEDAAQVLYEVGNTDYIYEQIGECIDDEVRRVMISNSYQKN